MPEALKSLHLPPQEILKDYRSAYRSRLASYFGRREVLCGLAKFGIFGDGKELPQLAMARAFRPGDFRSGYYRDQTFMLAVGALNLEQFFAQLFQIVDFAHRYNRKSSHVGTQYNGLRFIVAYDANPRVAVKITQFVFKLVAKVTVLDPVNAAPDDTLFVHGCQTSALGTHMRMIISAIKKRVRAWRL